MPAGMDGQRAGAVERSLGLELSDEQRIAARDAWDAFWRSRLLVWVAGILALVAFGAIPSAPTHDLHGLTEPFGPLGSILVAPAARWDSVWFLEVAIHGYDVSARTAFFPLYPLLLAAGAPFTGSALLVGLLVSGLATLAALFLLHRLVALDLGAERSRTVLMVAAFFPGALFFSAVYSESLYLALSVGAIYAARRGRWPLAASLGALCATTRSVGLLIVVPLAVLYLYGPRTDRPAALVRSLRPRYPLRRDFLWLGLVPLGLLAYLAYLGVTTGDPLSPFAAQGRWERHLTGPFVGVFEGALAALQGLRQLVSGERFPLYFPQETGDPFLIGARNILQFGFLLLAIAGTVGVFRRLPAAYGFYVLAALALPLSAPAAGQPLQSLPRFMAVLFPLHMWLALWASERGALRPVLVGSGAFLALWAGLFTTWTAAG